MTYEILEEMGCLLSADYYRTSGSFFIIIITSSLLILIVMPLIRQYHHQQHHKFLLEADPSACSPCSMSISSSYIFLQMQERMLPLDASPRRVSFFLQCLAVLAITLLMTTTKSEFDSSDAHRHEYLQAWLTLPPNVPPNINTEDELNAVVRFLAPVFSGGFGNVLYQMAAAYSITKEINSTCLIAWWDQLDSKLEKRNSPFGGRPPPAPGITLKHILPNIRYVDFYPATRQVLSSSNCPYFIPLKQRTIFVPFPPSLSERDKIWITGFFANYRCLFV
jgi:hypothetical protein